MYAEMLAAAPRRTALRASERRSPGRLTVTRSLRISRRVLGSGEPVTDRQPCQVTREYAKVGHGGRARACEEARDGPDVHRSRGGVPPGAAVLPAGEHPAG